MAPHTNRASSVVEEGPGCRRGMDDTRAATLESWPRHGVAARWRRKNSRENARKSCPRCSGLLPDRRTSVEKHWSPCLLGSAHHTLGYPPHSGDVHGGPCSACAYVQFGTHAGDHSSQEPTPSRNERWNSSATPLPCCIALALGRAPEYHKCTCVVVPLRWSSTLAISTLLVLLLALCL